MLEQENLDHSCTIKTLSSDTRSRNKTPPVSLLNRIKMCLLFISENVWQSKTLYHKIKHERNSSLSYSPNYAFLGLRPKRAALSQI